MMYQFDYPFPVGKIRIQEENEKIISLMVVNKKRKDVLNTEHCQVRETPLIKRAYRQLTEYFHGARREFDLPLNPKGTAFQKQVWEALLTIPYGMTCSYADIARKIGNPKAYRAVGGANNKNPIFIVIPCHRVIGANGSLVGYGGGIEMKKYLLLLEQGGGIIQ